MKHLLLLSLLFIGISSQAQWGYDRYNGPQGSFGIAYNFEIGNRQCLLKMEPYNGNITMYISDVIPAGKYNISAIFKSYNGYLTEVNLVGVVNPGSEIMILETALNNSWYLDIFKNSVECVMKCTNPYYSDRYYHFNMMYSREAYNFIYANRY